MSDTTITHEWVLSDDGTPFYTTQWGPSGDTTPKAYILFIHGFAEHIARYAAFFPILAAPPYSLHITAYDQRGHGKTAYESLTKDSPEVVAWKKEGKTVQLIKNGMRRNGGWGKALPDMEFFVKRESERALGVGKRLFLWGHSMGGGQSLAFVTRPNAPPSPSTLSLLTGCIISAPLIRQTTPAPWFQLKAGSIASNFLPNLLIPTPLDYDQLSHDSAAIESNRADPMCEQRGSVLGVADMLQGGISLDTPQTWARWPKGLPMMLYHGSADGICDVEASKRFFNGVEATHKRLEIIEGMRHEVHNELAPTPNNLAKMVSEWVNEMIDISESSESTIPGQAKL